MGTVLVAEDSKTIRTICKWVFKGSAHSVQTVGSGGDAMQHIQAGQAPEVLILDYTLPDQDAYDLCKSIKSNPQTAGIGVLMLGGAFASFDEGRAENSGADDFLTKPFKTDELFEMVDTLMTKVSEGSVKRLVAAAAPATPPAPARSAPAQPPTQPAPVQQPPAQQAPAEPQRPRFTFNQQRGQQPATPAAPQPPQQPQKRFSLNQQAQQQSRPAPPRHPAPPPQVESTPTPSSGLTAAPPAQPAPPQQPVKIDEAIIRAEVQRAVKALLPTMVRGVLKDLITKEVVPHLQRWIETKFRR